MKSEWKVYICNLREYTEGRERGAWFDFPLDEGKIREKIGLDAEHEEYAIHDYELPFEIAEYENISRLNKWYQMFLELPEEQQKYCKELISDYGEFEEICNVSDDIRFYPGITDMKELARMFVKDEEYGKVPENLQDYINYEAIGRDLEISGDYVVTAGGIFSLP